MPTRPDTLETLLLALELLRRIPRNRKVSASELHEQLQGAGIERGLRTIQRQLEMLTEHFEVERDDRDKPYGYRWKQRAKGFVLPRLTEQESLLLMLAELHLRNILPASLMKSMEGFFQEARANLGPSTNAGLEREWLKKVRIVSTTQPLLPPRVDPKIFESVSNALYRNQWLSVEYRNAAGRRTKYDVMPLGLAQQGPRLYLVCRYYGFANERSLALHRLASADVKSETFERPAEFDLQKYDDEGRFGFGNGKRVRLSFLIHKSAGQHLLESPLSSDQQATEIGEDIEIVATVVESAQLEWWLRSFGQQVRRITRKDVR